MDIEFKADTSILDKLFKDSEEYFKEIKSSSSYICNRCGNRMPEKFAENYNYKCSLCKGTLIKEPIQKNRKVSSSCEAQYFDN